MKLIQVILILFVSMFTLNDITLRAENVADDSELKKLLMIPERELAKKYLQTEFILEIIPAAEKGVTIRIGYDEIGPHNVTEAIKKYEKKRILYEKAIRKRGFVQISGLYKGTATESCNRIQSMWSEAITSKHLTKMQIKQDDFKFTMVQRLELDGKSLDLETVGVVIGSSMHFTDPMNSEYYFGGVISDQNIKVKPDFNSLQSWPSWAHPPHRADLINCDVELIKE